MNPSLESLVANLKLKTPFSEIDPAHHKVLEAFLLGEQRYREQAKIKWLLRTSGLKPVKTFAQFDWTFNPKIPKDDILAFAHSPWIDQARNLVLIGDVGIGKSHIVSALCYEAILKGVDTLFITAFDLVSKIKRALHPENKIDYFSRIGVLALDELGYT